MSTPRAQAGPGTEAAATLAARLQRTELLLQLTRELAEAADLDGVLELLVEKVPSLRLAVGQDLHYYPNFSFRGPRTLYVSWDE